MDEPKHPTPVRRQLSLTQAVLVKLIPIGLVLNLGMLTSSADVLLEYSVSHINFVHWAVRMPNSDKLCNNFRAARTNGCLDFSLSLLAVFDSIRICCGKSISGTFGFTGIDFLLEQRAIYTIYQKSVASKCKHSKLYKVILNYRPTLCKRIHVSCGIIPKTLKMIFSYLLIAH